MAQTYTEEEEEIEEQVLAETEMQKPLYYPPTLRPINFHVPTKYHPPSHPPLPPIPVPFIII